MRVHVCACTYNVQVTCMWQNAYMWCHGANGFKDVSPFIVEFSKVSVFLCEYCYLM